MTFYSPSFAQSNELPYMHKPPCCKCKKPKKSKPKKKMVYKPPETPPECSRPTYEPCVHLHFKTDTISRECLSHDQYLDMLATPKGYPWLSEVDCYNPDIQKSKSKKKKKVQKMIETPQQIARPDGGDFADEFVEDMWDVMSPEITDRLVDFLVNEFGMSCEEAEDFIDCKCATGKQTACRKKKSKPIIGLGPKHKWVKEFSDVFAKRIEQYIVSMLMTRRTPRVKMIAERILASLCDLTGEKTTLQSPKTKVQKTMVLISDRLALWIEDLTSDLDKPKRATITEPEEEEAEESEKEEPQEEEEKEEPEEKEEEPKEEEKEEPKEEEEKTEEPKDEEKEEEQPEEVEVKEEAQEEKEEEKPAQEDTPAEEEKQEQPQEEEQVQEEPPKQAEEEPEEVKEEPVKEEEKEPEPQAEPEKEEPTEPEKEAEPEPEQEPQPEEESTEPAQEEEKTAEEEQKPEEEVPEETEEVPPETTEEEPEKTEEEAKEEEKEPEPETEEEQKEEDEIPEEIPVEAAEEVYDADHVSEEKKMYDDIFEIVKEDIAGTPKAGQTDRQKAVKDVVDKRIEKILAGKETGLEPEDIDDAASRVAHWVEKLMGATEPKREIERKGPGAAFEVKPKTGSTLQVQKLSSGTVAEQTAKARGVEPPPRIRKMPATQSPVNLETAQEWVDWATNVANLADEWGTWLETKLTDAEKQVDKKQEDWRERKDMTQQEALKWRAEKARIRDEGKKWSKKLEEKEEEKEVRMHDDL